MQATGHAVGPNSSFCVTAIGDAAFSVAVGQTLGPNGSPPGRGRTIPSSSSNNTRAVELTVRRHSQIFSSPAAVQKQKKKRKRKFEMR